MSNKELDGLFKNKLENLQRMPSADAWSKIQAQTQQKTPVWPWMRIAAAILLLLVSGIVIWNMTQHDVSTNDTIVVNETQPKATTSEDSNAAIKIDDRANTAQKSEMEVKTAIKTDAEVKSSEKQPQPLDNTIPQLAESNNDVAHNEQDSETHTDINETIEATAHETLIAKNNTSDATIENENASQQQATEGTTLVFNIEDFKKAAVAANTAKANNNEASEPKKGLNKVLDLMKELKSDAGIGDIREAKNDLFAFNFKKDNDDDSE